MKQARHELLGFALILLSVFTFLPQSRAQEGIQRKALSAYWKIVEKSPSSTASLSPEGADALFRTLNNHPVASLNRVSEYDPQGSIGFCFGRDMAAFLIARQMGLEVRAMRSLFVIGDLRSGESPEWRFHVTKVVRLSDGSWWAIDPIMPQSRPVSVDEWISTVQMIWDKQHMAKFYVVPPFHVLPDVRNMRPPDKETGRDIIDLSFEPNGKRGIAPAKIFGHLRDRGVNAEVYELSEAAAKHYFISTNEEPADTFSFERLEAAGMVFDYNGYFVDLLKTQLNSDNPLRPTPEFASGFAASGFLEGRRSHHPRVYGMRFDSDFYRELNQRRGSRR